MTSGNMTPVTGQINGRATTASGIPYHFEGRNILVVDIDGEPWFVAADAARELGYREAYDLARNLDEDEKGTQTVRTPGGDQEVLVISEPGLYRAIIQRRANKKHDASLTAKIARFQRWVFHDILPSIRKTGGYQVPAQIPNFADPVAAARAWADQYEARLYAERTKAEIGSRREATAMNTASLAVKKATRLEIELDRSRSYATVKRMTLLHHGQEFSWRVLKHISAEMSIPPIDVFDANYGTVKAYHADVWREAYALDIPATDLN